MQRHSIKECITLACLLEVMAAKPGNVHRAADFETLTLNDLAVSAVVVGKTLAAAQENVGVAVLHSIQETQRMVQTNSNLGMVLLLAPLAAVPSNVQLTVGLKRVLQSLNSDDALNIWRAIQLAKAGGLGTVAEQDLAGPPPDDILEAMRLAVERDLIAAQYSNEYTHVFEYIVPWLLESRQQLGSLTEAIIYTHVKFLAHFPDSLIARKAGLEIAQQAMYFAQQIMTAFDTNRESYNLALADFDFWLRSDGHKRNPGTTADLIAVGLFVLLREEMIEPPYR